MTVGAGGGSASGNDGGAGEAMVSGSRRRGLRRRLKRWLILVGAGFVVISTFVVAIYGFLPVPVTPLMLLRLAEGEGIEKDWVAYENISPHVFRAVIAAEDTRFCQHVGFDFAAIAEAWRKNQRGRGLFGASTITQQTAKNVFLWPGNNIVSKSIRKLFEIYYAVLIEIAWSKRRILEVYVNVVEWDNGVYGIEAAARRHFGKSATDLSRREAALLAAVLPNPRRWTAGKPTRYINRRAGTILERMRIMPNSDDPFCPVGPMEEPK